MRLLAPLALVAVLSGCVAIPGVETPAPTPVPTVAPAATPTATPTAIPTSPPTPPPTASSQTTETTPPTPTSTLAPGQTPKPTPIDIRPFLTAGITVYNLGDTSLYVTVNLVDTDTGEKNQYTTFQIEPEQFSRQTTVATRYELDFSYSQTESDTVGKCTIDVADADEVSFVAVATGVVVTKNGVQPEQLSEMSVATSSLCQAGGAP